MKEAVIHELFDQQTARTPSAIAVRCGTLSLTYAELRARANQFARCLRGMGVGPEAFVGILLEPSLDAVIALLGTLKAGGAYLYLDPGLPQGRLEFFLNDARPFVVVTNQRLRGRAGSQFGCLDVCSPDLIAEDPSDLPLNVTPENAAYLLYTSGSTGEPKGAVEIHRCLTARLEAGEMPDIQPGDVCALNSSLAFGITTSRLLLPLALGAQIVILSEAESKDPLKLLRAIDSNRIASIFLPPPMLKMMVSVDSNLLASLTQLRCVATTGSTLKSDVIEAFFKALPHSRLVNLYGSTEIGTTAIMNVLSRTATRSPNSIGKPVVGTKVYIVDEAGSPAPAGESGELHVSAPHLAREYLNKPELTKERFITLPFAPQERVYRTGDLGRYLPNGEIEFLGRRDHQVKIRGLRVELREVEAVLERHQDILEAVASVHGDSVGGERLVTHFTTRLHSEPTAGELRDFLRSRLPTHMIPSAFIRLLEMPRTISGKVDRLALPAYDARRPDLNSPFESPRNASEAVLASIWSAVLKVQDVGIHDNFFELGGDSLAATQVIVQCHERMGLKVLLEQLFDSTIAVIAAPLSS